MALATAKHGVVTVIVGLAAIHGKVDIPTANTRHAPTSAPVLPWQMYHLSRPRIATNLLVQPASSPCKSLPVTQLILWSIKHREVSRLVLLCCQANCPFDCIALPVAINMLKMQKPTYF